MSDENKQNLNGSSDDVQDDETDPSIKFHYIKSNFNRVIHVDGIWGGITPSLNIQMAPFSERGPIPIQTTHEINPDGSVGKELAEEKITKDGIVREIEAVLVINTEVAQAMVDWLRQKIATVEKIRQKQAELIAQREEKK